MTEEDRQVETINGIVYQYLTQNNYTKTAEEFLKETDNKINKEIESKNMIYTLPALIDVFMARNEHSKNINIINKIEMVLMAQENTKRKIQKEQEEGDNIMEDPVTKKINKRIKSADMDYFSHINNKPENNPPQHYNSEVSLNHPKKQHIPFFYENMPPVLKQSKNKEGYIPFDDEYIRNDNVNPVFFDTLNTNRDNSDNNTGFNMGNRDSFSKIETYPHLNEFEKNEQIVRLIQQYTFPEIKITVIAASATHEMFIIGKETGGLLAVFLKDMNPISLETIRPINASIDDILIENTEDSVNVAVTTSEFEIIIFNINCNTMEISVICDLTLNNRIVSFAFNKEFLYIAYEDRVIQKVNYVGDIIKSSILNNVINKIIYHCTDILIISDSVQVIVYDYEKENIITELTTKPVDLLKKDNGLYIICTDDIAAIYSPELELKNKVHIGIEYTTVSITGSDNVFVAFNKEVYWHGACMKCLNTQTDTIYSLICFKVEDQICLVTGSFSGEVNVYFASYE